MTHGSLGQTYNNSVDRKDFLQKRLRKHLADMRLSLQVFITGKTKIANNDDIAFFKAAVERDIQNTHEVLEELCAYLQKEFDNKGD